MPYDARWPARFEAERSALETALGDRLVGGVHHVGSTAVPGLDAKPIVDILAGVDALATTRHCVEMLERVGWCYAPYRTREMHWFCKPDPSRRTHHLHLVPVGSPRFRAELAFRDHLRANPGDAAEYATLKRRLAARHGADREAYTEGKTEFIRAILQRASDT
ncbi:MAG: GrpB family protein [Solirubrobacteraceae bacterium]